MAGKFKGTFPDLPGWQTGYQGLGSAVLLMAAIVATMAFSFWVFRVGPFSDGKNADTVNYMRFQAVNNPGASASRANGSENYSSAVSQILDNLTNSADASLH